MKNLILCADDFGMNKSISEAIINLSNKKRITATSCMTNFDWWNQTPIPKDILLGLHFNLTEGCPITHMPKMFPNNKFCGLNYLLKLLALNKLNLKEIENEHQAQIKRFYERVGNYPDFIDGHQHIHQFKGIRDIVLNQAKQILVFNKTKNNTAFFLRSTHPLTINLKNKDLIKSLIIGLTGGYSFAKKLKKENITFNKSFSGIYNFFDKNLKSKYRNYFNFFLKKSKTNGLIMCHPGMSSNLNTTDEIISARQIEYDYLMSDDYLNDLKINKIKLVKNFI